MDEENGGLIKLELVEVEDQVLAIPVPKIRSKQAVCRKRKAVKSAENETFCISWKFQEKWLENENFQPWLEKVQGDTSKAHCVWCEVNFHAKLHAIRRHMETKRHKLIVDQHNNAIQHLEKPSNSKSPIKEEAEAGKACIINLLRSYLHEDEDSEARSHDEKENKMGVPINFTEMIKEQVERNNLMSALVNVQKEKLRCEQEQLYQAKKRLHLQQKLFDMLKTKLSATVT